MRSQSLLSKLNKHPNTDDDRYSNNSIIEVKASCFITTHRETPTVPTMWLLSHRNTLTDLNEIEVWKGMEYMRTYLNESETAAPLL